MLDTLARTQHNDGHVRPDVPLGAGRRAADAVAAFGRWWADAAVLQSGRGPQDLGDGHVRRGRRGARTVLQTGRSEHGKLQSLEQADPGPGME